MCRDLNYFEHFLVFVSAVSGFVSISAFALLIHVPLGKTSSTEGLKIFAIIAGTKNYKSNIRKKRKTHGKIKY